MQNKTMKFDLLVDLSTEEQQILTGGKCCGGCGSCGGCGGCGGYGGYGGYGRGYGGYGRFGGYVY